MNEKEQAIFNALCNVVIFNDCDVRHTEGDDGSNSSNLLIANEIIEDWEDCEYRNQNANRAYIAYEKMVCEYVEDHLPEGWKKRFDYWGALCYSNNDSWESPKSNTLYAGDTGGKIMFFESYQALEEYTNEKLQELETKE